MEAFHTLFCNFYLVVAPDFYHRGSLCRAREITQQRTVTPAIGLCGSSSKDMEPEERGGGGGLKDAGSDFCEIKVLSLASFRIPAVCLLCLRLCALSHQPKSPCQPRKRPLFKK